MSESPNRNNENNTPEREQRSLTQTISDAADSARSLISSALGFRQEQDVISTPTHNRTEDYLNVNTPRNPLSSPTTVASSLATPRSILSPRIPSSRRSQRSHTNTPRKSHTSTPRRPININPEDIAD